MLAPAAPMLLPPPPLSTKMMPSPGIEDDAVVVAHDHDAPPLATARRPS